LQILSALPDLSAAPRGASYAIGNFDGFHLGHRALIERVCQEPGPNGLITFEPHPRRLFQPDGPPQRLMSREDKQRQARALGLDVYVELPFTWDFAGLGAEAFHQAVLEPLAPRLLVTGQDFHYGKKRCGSLQTLRAAGYQVDGLAKVGDASGEAYGSSRIRQAIRDADFEQVARLMGAPWTLTSRVEQGDQIGRTIGFPTANLSLGGYLRPPIGIYAARVGLGEDAPSLPAAAYYGFRPSIDGQQERFEVHLLDFEGDLYGQQLRVALIQHLRGDKALDGLEALKAQIAEDCQQARQVLARS
jgi:riboflavin kinase/FMN adenylyltransferase